MDVEEAERRSLVEFLHKQALERRSVNGKLAKARQFVKKELDRMERQARKA